MRVEQEILSYNTLTIAGLKGTGKTFALSILANADKRKSIILDTLGVITKNKLIKKAIYIKITKNDLELKKLAKALNNALKNYEKVVFDLSFLIPKELVQFSDYLSLLLSIKKEDVKISLYIDEIAEYLPQTRAPTYSYELERVVRVGRNFGIETIIMTTQRLQKASKDVLALSEAFIFFKIIYDIDRKLIRELINEEKEFFESLENDLMKLEKGKAIYYVPFKYYYVEFKYPDEVSTIFILEDREKRIKEDTLELKEEKETKEETQETKKEENKQEEQNKENLIMKSEIARRLLKRMKQGDANE